MSRLLIFNGPNLDLFCSREPDPCGSRGRGTVETQCRTVDEEPDHEPSFFQSKYRPRARRAGVRGRHLIHRADSPAFTRTRVAPSGALFGIRIPFIGVQIADVCRCEAFRHRSNFSDVAVDVIGAPGASGYELAIRAVDSPLAAAENGERENKNGHPEDQETD